MEMNIQKDELTNQRNNKTTIETLYGRHVTTMDWGLGVDGRIKGTMDIVHTRSIKYKRGGRGGQDGTGACMRSPLHWKLHSEILSRAHACNKA